ncbi:MAG: hypothetical protein H6932_02750 [Burkholderiaceae bacterium]|nr:hypothetical protein [Burkholderiaceae bacterium]
MAAPEPPKNPPGGIHISRGVALRIPAGGLQISLDESGEVKVQFKEIHLRLDTSTEWLEIAMERLADCDAAQTALLAAYAANEEVGDHIHRVLKASMQAIVASATFFEALYAAARDHLPPNRVVRTPDGRPGRSREAYVTEQLKQAFGLKKKGTTQLRSVLGEIYRFRDETVHPQASFGPPAWHPDLRLLVERRVAMFSFSNTKLLVRAALAYCKILPEVAKKQGPKEIKALADYLLTSGEPLFQRWEAKYGPLLDEAAA